MYPRRLIIADKSITHVTFRCHNRQYFLKSQDVKVFLLKLWAKYKTKYRIKIFDFNIMDNHVHLIAQIESSEHLSNFMRTVNSQLARYINEKFDRDSQAIRDRFKSPMITNLRYLTNTICYVWMNRYKINRASRPEHDPFCSASWRLNRNRIKAITRSKKEFEQLSNLLDSYSKLPVPVKKKETSFVKKLLVEAIKKVDLLTASVYESSHTIGDEIDVKFRGELLSAFRREHVPWVLI